MREIIWKTGGVILFILLIYVAVLANREHDKRIAKEVIKQLNLQK
jgi:hypothetical protein